MSSDIYRYQDIYKKYDMTGEIQLDHGILMVHDIFDETPKFMLSADYIFCDPPCSEGNLKCFYTKAELDPKGNCFQFRLRLFEVLEEISPKVVAMELFKSDKDAMTGYLRDRYPYVKILDSMYYKNPNNQCWVAIASQNPIDDWYDGMNGMDEERIIEEICKNADFDCIGDPCMGKGLVAFYASKYCRNFVGTELDVKRLGVAVERCVTGNRGRIN